MNNTKEFIKNHKVKFTIYVILGLIFIFFLWWLISFFVNSTLFPSPLVVIPIVVSLLGKSTTYLAIGGTFLRLLITFLISASIGILLGLLAGSFYRFEAFLKPLIGLLRTLPTAAVVLILIALLKPFYLPIIVSTLVMFPLFYNAVLNGIKNIPNDLKDTMRIDNVHLFNSYFKVYLPIIKPYLVLAVIQSIGLGLKVSIMAEIVGGSNQIFGLGRLIQANYIDANSANVLAYSLIAILIIVIVDIVFGIVKGVVENGPRKNK